jgi:hypothetical protein
VWDRRLIPILIVRAFAAEGFEIPDIQFPSREVWRRDSKEIIGPGDTEVVRFGARAKDVLCHREDKNETDQR